MKKLYLFFHDVGLIDFQPLDCGMEECHSGYTYGPCVRGHYLLHYVFSGGGTLEKDGIVTNIHAGEAFLIRPDENCTYRADEKDPWTYAWIGFLGMQSKKMSNAPDVFALPPDIFESMLSVFEKAQNQEEFMAGILFRILAHISLPTEQKSPVETVIHYLSFNYMHSIRIEEIAAIVHLNRKYLVRIFKKETGLTMQEFLTQCRMKEAARFLSGGYSVSETASFTGYGDGFAFSKAFKKYYGMPPKSYREQQKKKHD